MGAQSMRCDETPDREVMDEIDVGAVRVGVNQEHVKRW